MRVLLQRVAHAKVEVSGKSVGAIKSGLLLFVGFAAGDDDTVLRKLAEKIVNLRVFPDDSKRLQHSVADLSLEILAVPQFTLYASANRGRRPDFTQALPSEQARALFMEFADVLSQLMSRRIETGRFGAEMSVTLCNDGPFTMQLERSAATGVPEAAR